MPDPIRYCCSAAIVTVTVLLRVMALPILPIGYPFLLLFGSVLLVSAMFGRGCGLFSTGLSSFYAAAFLLPPVGTLEIHDIRAVVALVLFLAIASTMALVIAAMQDAVADLQQSEVNRSHLLKEFRHRSRNDLASLAAMLLLRARVAVGEEARAALREAASHAMALSRVHSLLAKATPGQEDGAVIYSDEFVGGLVEVLSALIAPQGLRPVAVHVSAERHMISNERAVPVGLVLHECMTNAGKYAFPEDRQGAIEVRFWRDNADFVLLIEDDGVGLPTGGVVETGLGTRLLRGLGAQLRGSFSRKPGRGGIGVRCELRFPAFAVAPLHTAPH